MCGIVGLFLKRPGRERQLGACLAAMLVTMRDRGPDNAGFAVYGPGDERVNLTVRATTPAADLAGLAAELGVTMQRHDTHAVLHVPASNVDAVRAMPGARDDVRLVRRYDAITAVADAMAALGWEPYQNDHEDANGQYEINWAYAPAPVTADRHAFFKYMVRSIAEIHGMRATFMPKPFAHLTGSGCHAHVSLWQTGGNAFAGTDGHEVPPLARQFVGGLLAHAEALCALTNPTVNSCKRINAPATRSGATWPPNTITWGGNNRTHLIRLPGHGRIEYRLADGAANPYPLQAGLLAAGLDGIAAARDPGPPFDIDMYAAEPGEGVRRLPLNLLDALRAFAASDVLRETLGAGFCNAYLAQRQAAWNDYARHLTD